MITAESIDRIRAVTISQVIDKYVTIKKKGANWQGCCPFHNEKTPSFSVNDIKGIYKCFGCGASGDAIGFVMQKENATFYKACKTVAEITNTEIDFEEREYSEKEKQALSAAQQQEEVLNYCVPVYQEQLFNLPNDHPAKIWLQERNITSDVIAEWKIGWSPDDWNFISTKLINKNWYEPAFKQGIIKRSRTDSNYDGYRSRIIFPITDAHGRYIGLGGRYIRISASDAHEIPKYVNPAASELYNKSAVLYGLSNAAKEIRNNQPVGITEGYMDVVTPHMYGWKHIVATCGTAFTKEQMRLLKRYTNHVIMMRDNDAAGVKSFQTSLPELLKEGFKVDIMLYDAKDPDEYFRRFDSYHNPGGVTLPTITDAFLYRAKEAWKNIADQPQERASTKQTILELLTYVPHEILRNNYLDALIKELSWKASETKKEYNSIIESVSYKADEDFDDESSAIKFAQWMSEEQKEQCLTNGYLAVNRKEKGRPMVGYYSFGNNGKSEITNFIVQPLFHVYAGVESRYLVKIYNGYRNAVLDVPARVIPSIDQFQAFTVSEGNFLIFGSKPQWLRIASELLQTFPRCMELSSLGWQSHHFFSWVDKVYVPGEGLRDLDDWGIFKFKDENFLVPASCEAYKQLERTGDDPYENDRYLTFKASPVTFSDWALQMQRVYLDKGPVAVAYSILTLFRDIIFDVDNNCPHLYAFGEPSSGKSKWAESITAIFYFKRSAFNLNSGTDFAFFNYMQRYRNCPAHLNEFEIEVIKQEWFQAIKGVYDGEGRERGKQNGPKNRTEVMRVRSTLILTGQKLVTADDNSVVTRSIIEPFSTRDDMKEDDKLAYDKLKGWEAKGLSSMLTELLQHREHFEKNYKDLFNDQLSAWRKEKTEARQLNQRILQNFSHLSTCYKIIAGFLKLPTQHEEFTAYCYKQAIKWSKFIRSSDTLSEFWRTLEFLYNQQDVEEGWDFIVEETMSVNVRVNKDESKEHHFDEPTKVLYLRLNNIHKLFQRTYKLNTGKEAMNIDNLLHYFSSRKYYVGPVKQKRFKRFVTVTENLTRPAGQSFQTVPETGKKEQESVTSCHAFIYEDLDITVSHNSPVTTQEGWVQSKMAEVMDLPFTQ